jgi:hypothetical protein
MSFCPKPPGSRPAGRSSRCGAQCRSELACSTWYWSARANLAASVGIVASSTPAWWPHRCTGLAHCDRGLRDDTTNCCTTADLAACLQREVAARESRGGEGRIRVARFPARRSLQDFDSCRVADIIMNGDPDLLARGRAGRGRRRSPRCRCRATRSRGRGPATRHAGSAGAAGPARRRLPGRRLLRQSPRRDHPRPADRRRRPHRPPRPRPHHRVPARRLASPDRMDEPVPGRLRAACHRGLTSPTRSPHPHGGQAASPGPSAEYPDKPQNRPAAGKPRPENQQDHLSASRNSKTGIRISAVD